MKNLMNTHIIIILEGQHQAPKVAEQCVLQANPAYVTRTTEDRVYETIAAARQHDQELLVAEQANPAYVARTTADREYEKIADARLHDQELLVAEQANPAYVARTTADREYEKIADARQQDQEPFVAEQARTTADCEYADAGHPPPHS